MRDGALAAVGEVEAEVIECLPDATYFGQRRGLGRHLGPDVYELPLVGDGTIALHLLDGELDLLALELAVGHQMLAGLERTLVEDAVP